MSYTEYEHKTNMMSLKTCIFKITALFSLILLYLDSPLAFAQDAEPLPIKVIQPAYDEQISPVMVDGRVMYMILVIENSVELDSEEEYESPYFDVRDYREVTFYIQPDPGTSLPLPDVKYKLDAFFSIDNKQSTALEIGAQKAKRLATDYQEFGSMLVKSEDEMPVPLFKRLTTGETAIRGLHSKVYGPFMRVTLINMTPKKKCNFKISAFLTR
ncbi:MAG: hypothetical protein JW867_02250 [Candidatus Omnitrophica bacterium]|nr:hypothetical protein [Candidatus Omnitrophota bacterium]